MHILIVIFRLWTSVYHRWSFLYETKLVTLGLISDICCSSWC